MWICDLQNTPGGTSWVTRRPTSASPLSMLLFLNDQGTRTQEQTASQWHLYTLVDCTFIFNYMLEFFFCCFQVKIKRLLFKWKMKHWGFKRKSCKFILQGIWDPDTVIFFLRNSIINLNWSNIGRARIWGDMKSHPPRNWHLKRTRREGLPMLIWNYAFFFFFFEAFRYSF